MGADRTQPSGDGVHRAADERIRKEAIRLLEEVRPGDDDWRLASLDPDQDERDPEPETAGDPSEASTATRPEESN
ncbi:MAG: hypothetical protein OEV40_10275 [Acidimicrobiia bacterium]|nr:hypothetical protein [Acidimicrobiia bacterium]